jgi:DmsE family decaheme c-type cytochrome
MGGVTCPDCHNPHQAGDTVRKDVCFTCHKERRAQSMRSNHMPIKEGKMVCSSCHNQHGSTGPKMLIKNTVTETCYTCHAEKRGPFLWEHPPVSDDCTNCHNPHGSVNASLLKSRPPFLCAQCHIAGGHSTTGIRSGYDLGNAVVPGGAKAGTTATTGAAAGSTAAAAQMVEKSCLSCHLQIHGSNSPSGARWTR